MLAKAIQARPGNQFMAERHKIGKGDWCDVFLDPDIADLYVVKNVLGVFGMVHSEFLVSFGAQVIYDLNEDQIVYQGHEEIYVATNGAKQV